MNIKGLNPNIIPLEPRTKVESNRAVKTQESTERDPNGRQEAPDKENRRHLSDEEFQSALEKLENHPGIKANALVVRVETKEDGLRLVFIEDPSGQLVRRFTEGELWQATLDPDRTKGQILDKAM